MKQLGKLLLSAGLAYSTHYGVAKLYNYVCLPDGFFGFFSGMLTTGSPVCQTVYSIMNHTQVTYSTIIFVGITHAIVDCLPSFEHKDTDHSTS